MDRDTAKSAHELIRPAVLWINYDTLWFPATQQETMIGASTTSPDNQHRHAFHHHHNNPATYQQTMLGAANNPDNLQRHATYHSNQASAATKTRWLPRNSETGEKRRWIPPKDAKEIPSNRFVGRADGYDPRVHSVVWYPESSPRQYSDLYYNRVGVTNYQNSPYSEYVNTNRYDGREYYIRGLNMVPIPDNQPRVYPLPYHGERYMPERMQYGSSNFDNRYMHSKQPHSAYRYTDLEHPGRMDGHYPQGHVDRQIYRPVDKDKLSHNNYQGREILSRHVNKSIDHRVSGDESRSEMNTYYGMHANKSLILDPESRDYRQRPRHGLESDFMPRPSMTRHAYPDHALWNEESPEVVSQQRLHQTTKQSDYIRSMTSSSSRNSPHERLVSETNAINKEASRDIYPPSGVSGKTSKDFSYPPINRPQKRSNQNPLSEKDARRSAEESGDQRSKLDPVNKRDSSYNEDTTDKRSDDITSTPNKAHARVSKDLFQDNSDAEKTPLQENGVSPGGHNSLPDPYPCRYSRKDERETDNDCTAGTHFECADQPDENYAIGTDSDCKNNVDKNQTEHVQNNSETNPSIEEQINSEEQTHPSTVTDVISSVSLCDVHVSTSESTPTDKTCSTSTKILNSGTDHTMVCDDDRSHDQNDVSIAFRDHRSSFCNAECTARQRSPPGDDDKASTDTNHQRNPPTEDNPVSNDTHQQEESCDSARPSGHLNTTESDAEIARCLFESIDWTVESDADTTDSSPELEFEIAAEDDAPREIAIRGLTERELTILPSSKLQKIPATGKCEICWDSYKVGDGVRYLICAHYFHLACIDEWLKRTATCPVCRTVLADLFLQDVVTSVRRRRRRCIIL